MQGRREQYSLRGMDRSNGSHLVSILCTGGTFDKSYDPIKERLVVSGRPAAERIVTVAQVLGVSVSVAAQKDSLDLTEEELLRIRDSIEKVLEKRVVVVHGTSRLIENAMKVRRNVGKTVVFTGAMVPASIDSTEASFNLGFALAAARILEPGVWIAMSGEIFRPQEVIKNADLGRFERILE